MKKILLVLLLIVASVYADELNFGEKECKDTSMAEGDVHLSKVIIQTIKSNGFTVGQKLNFKDKTLKYDVMNNGIYKSIYNPQSPYSMQYIGYNPTSKIITGFRIPHYLKDEECLIEKEKFLKAVFKKYGGIYVNQIGYSKVAQTEKEYTCKYDDLSDGSVVSGDNVIIYRCHNTDGLTDPRNKHNYILMYDDKLTNVADKENDRIIKAKEKKAFDNMLQ